MMSLRTGVSLTVFLVALVTGTPALAEEDGSLSFDQGLSFSRSFTAPQDSGGHLSEAAAEAQGYRVLKTWSSIADGTTAPARYATADRGWNASAGQNYSLADVMADAVWRKRVARSLWGD